MILNRLDRSKKPYALQAFLWAFLLSAFIVIPVMIYDHGYFLYYGDFNVQEVPFYELAHDAVRNGETGWSHLTDLGANFVGSYSFYLLGSPFFWLTILLPSTWVAHTLGPLLMLKLGFASLTSYIYLRRYVRDKKYAVIGGILYAFSSFSVYNIFFFHFHEPMIFFPLLLAAFDEYHATKRKGVVALAVFACAAVNYYFFVGQVVFTVIYYVVKLISKSYRFNLWEFAQLAVECVIGFSMSMFLLLPSIAAITGNYRISELINGWNALIYKTSQRYPQILVSMFFPGDVPAKNDFTASAGAKWSSVAAYLPMFSMTFIIACLRSKSRSLFKRLMIILLIMAFVPILNSLFQMLNDDYYARWFYILTLIMCVITVQSLDRFREVDFKKGFLPTAIITVLTAVLIGLMPEKKHPDGEKEYLKIGLEQSRLHFWLFVAFAVVGLALTLLIYILCQKKPKLLFRLTALLLSAFVVAYSVSYIWYARHFSDRSDQFLIEYGLNDGEDLTLDDVKDVRSDFYNTSDNMGMFWQVPNIQAFHSIVPGSLIDFYNSVGVERNVGSRPSTEFYGLRGLLSVKYLFREYDEDKEPKEHFEYMPGFSHIGTENGFEIYENEHYIPMGFTYDRFFTQEEYSDLSDDVKHLALLKAMVLSQEQMEIYRDITGYTDGMYTGLDAGHNDYKPMDTKYPKYPDFDSVTSDFEYTEQDYFNDTKKLATNSCSSFAYTKEGFTAEFTNNGGDNLLFFSVPFDNGWSAYVNGEKTDIEVVNIGFMAVRVPGNRKSTIEFRYQTPCLMIGCIISAASFGVLLLYLIIFRGLRAKRAFRKRYRIKQKTQIQGGSL